MQVQAVCTASSARLFSVEERGADGVLAVCCTNESGRIHVQILWHKCHYPVNVYIHLRGHKGSLLQRSLFTHLGGGDC